MRATKILKASTLSNKIKRLNKHLNKKIRGKLIHFNNIKAKEELKRLLRLSPN